MYALSILIPSFSSDLDEVALNNDGLRAVTDHATRQRFNQLGSRLYHARENYGALCHLAQVLVGEMNLVFLAASNNQHRRTGG